MSNNFRVGQKVVCVKRWPWVSLSPFQLAYAGPHYGDGLTYTIRGIADNYVALQGFPFDLWGSRNFRPAVEPEIDISIFTRMLTPTLEPAQ